MVVDYDGRRGDAKASCRADRAAESGQRWTALAEVSFFKWMDRALDSCALAHLWYGTVASERVNGLVSQPIFSVYTSEFRHFG
jgi:hypothetical protein